MPRRSGGLRLDLDDPVLDPDRERADWHDGGQRERPAGADVEARAVARADDDALVGVEVALAERPLVVRAAILDRAELAAEVVDADLELPLRDDLRGAGRQLLERPDLEIGHTKSISSCPAHSSGSGVPAALFSATFSVPSPSSAHLSRTGVSGVPDSS